MTLHRTLLVAALLVAPSLQAATVPSTPELDEAVYATRVDSRIEIGPDGTVVRYEPVTELKEPLATRVRAMAEGLRFEPVLVDGKPVVARTRMRLHLAAVPQEDGNLRVGIEHVGFPDDDGSTTMRAGTEENPYIHGVAKRLPISYPDEALRMALSGRVMVALRLAPDGSVIDAVPRESALYGVKGRDRSLARALAIFERAATQAIRRWRFDVRVPEGAYPTPEQLTGAINVEYLIDDHPKARPGLWLYESRSRERTLPWLDPMLAERLPDMGDLGDNGHFGIAPRRFRLLSPADEVAL